MSNVQFPMTNDDIASQYFNIKYFFDCFFHNF